MSSKPATRRRDDDGDESAESTSAESTAVIVVEIATAQEVPPAERDAPAVGQECAEQMTAYAMACANHVRDQIVAMKALYQSYSASAELIAMQMETLGRIEAMHVIDFTTAMQAGVADVQAIADKINAVVQAKRAGERGRPLVTGRPA